MENTKMLRWKIIVLMALIKVARILVALLMMRVAAARRRIGKVDDDYGVAAADDDKDGDCQGDDSCINDFRGDKFDVMNDMTLAVRTTV